MYVVEPGGYEARPRDSRRIGVARHARAGDAAHGILEIVRQSHQEEQGHTIAECVPLAGKIQTLQQLASIAALPTIRVWRG